MLGVILLDADGVETVFVKKIEYVEATTNHVSSNNKHAEKGKCKKNRIGSPYESYYLCQRNDGVR